MAVGVSCPVVDGEKDTTHVSLPSRFLARQPILNVRREVIGYELLFRTGWENRFDAESGEATRQTLDQLLCIGVASLTNHHLAFLNCTREALVDKLVVLLPVATTVLEVLETVEPDREVIEACRELRQLGYLIALDDFLPHPKMLPLIELATFVKVDFRLADRAVRRDIQRMTHGSGAALLAEKVEDQDEFEMARDEGYEFFQGYFFCKPKIIANREIPPNRMNYLRLLVELMRKPLHVDEVLHIVELEPSLCYRLLRLANSPLWGIRNDVANVRNALMLVGEERFRTLVSVAASCALGQHQPSALISLSLERARFCELVAPLFGEDLTEQFLLGLLSLMDAILEVPMESIVESLPLRGEAKAALLGKVSPATAPLCLIRTLESGGWRSCANAPGSGGLTEERLSQLYVESVKWATEALALSR